MEGRKELSMRNMIPMIVVVAVIAMAGAGVYYKYRHSRGDNAQITAGATNGPTTIAVTVKHARFDQ